MQISNFVRRTYTAVFCGLSVLAISASANAATLTPVDLELSLLVDVSGSIDSSEFNLQKQGYVDVFSKSDLFNNFISQGALGKIAVNLVYWSSAGQQKEAVGWTLIDSVTSSQQFANAINAAARPFSDSTAPGSAIAFATPRFFNNQFDGTRQVIDVSGDGEENNGLDTATARNNALAQGIDAINGIVIGGDPQVKNFYKAEVIGGINADGSPGFVVEAKTFQEFGSVIDDKIKAEIKPTPTPVPEPTSMMGLITIGFVGGSFLLKRSQKQKATC